MSFQFMGTYEGDDTETKFATEDIVAEYANTSEWGTYIYLEYCDIYWD